MWQCPRCREEIEEAFDVCWACGTSREGVEDRLFKPVVDQPELPASVSNSVTIRGLKAGAAVSVLMALVHPFIMLFLTYLANPAPIRLGALRLTFLFAFIWAAYAAIGGGIAGVIGARARTQRSALIAGLVSCVLLHIIFLGSVTSAFEQWPPGIVLGSLSIAALTGLLAGSAGLVVARKRGCGHGGDVVKRYSSCSDVDGSS